MAKDNNEKIVKIAPIDFSGVTSMEKVTKDVREAIGKAMKEKESSVEQQNVRFVYGKENS